MKQRIVTGVVAGAGFLVLLAMGSYGYAALILLLAVVGFFEYVRMNGLVSGWMVWLGYAGVVYATLPLELFSDRLPSFEGIAWLVMFLLLCGTVISKNKVTIDGAALVFLGFVYIGLGFHYMAYTRLADPAHGLYWTLLVFVCIWASDSGAYFAGRAFGKRLLWPSISPKKTVEGALGGVVLAMAAAAVFSVIHPELLALKQALLLGAVIAVVGQMGDFIQSAYKRVRNIKDTGAILPGHGGVLDRCDSWLIVFPLLHLLGLIPV